MPRVLSLENEKLLGDLVEQSQTLLATPERVAFVIKVGLNPNDYSLELGSADTFVRRFIRELVDQGRRANLSTIVDMVSATKEDADQDLGLIRSELYRSADIGPATPVPQAWVVFQTTLRIVYRRIEVIGNYKAVHDDLDELEYTNVKSVFRFLDGFPDRITDPEGFEESLDDFEHRLQSLERDATRLTNTDTSWVSDLKQAYRQLREALPRADTDQIRRFRKRVKQTLATCPTDIVIRLSEAARELPELVRHAAGVRNDLDDVRRARLDQMSEIEKKLTALIELHNKWQDIESYLRSLENNLDTKDPDLWWLDLQKKTQALHEEDHATWAEDLKSHGANLQSAIVSADCDAIEKWFRVYRRDLRRQFYFTDQDLKHLLDELPRAVIY
jgi:hypothetical protein